MDTDCDIVQWRNDYPVDYNKMAEAIINYPAGYQLEMYECIYNIIRRYIPQQLYKYYSLTEDDGNEKSLILNNKKFQTLSKKQLYLASYPELNDPFEGKGFFTNLGTKNDSFFEVLLSNIRLTSLTGCGMNSMPMWAHYANNHRGFCVAYDMTTKDNFMLCSSTFPIEYSEHRLDITNVMQGQIKKIIHEKEKTKMNWQKRIIICSGSDLI